MDIINSKYTGIRQSRLTQHYLFGNGYRCYIPVLKRFSVHDSLSPFSLGGYHGYSYGGSNPINNTDPTGRILWQEFAILLESFFVEDLAIGETAAIEASTEVVTSTIIDATTSIVKEKLSEVLSLTPAYDNILRHLNLDEAINMLEYCEDLLDRDLKAELDLLHDIKKYTKIISKTKYNYNLTLNTMNRIRRREGTTRAVLNERQRIEEIRQLRHEINDFFDELTNNLKDKHGMKLLRYNRFLESTLFPGHL